GGEHPRAAQLEAVVARDRRRLVGEAGSVQGGEEEVARPVAGEDAPRAVAAVRRRREAEDHDARRGVAEARDRAAPVVLVREGGPLDARDLLAPGDQSRAAPAGDDLGFELS